MTRVLPFSSTARFIFYSHILLAFVVHRKVLCFGFVHPVVVSGVASTVRPKNLLQHGQTVHAPSRRNHSLFKSSSSEESSSSSIIPNKSTLSQLVTMPIDIIGKTTSILVAGSVFIAICYYRDAVTFSLFVGSVSNGILSKILKRLLNISRPEALATSDRVSVKPADKGMPSSHAMSLGFIGMYTALQVPWAGTAIVAYTICSLIYRVRAALHTTNQVLVGLVLGSLNGYIWWHWTNTGVLNTSFRLADWISQHVLTDNGLLPYPMLLVPLVIGGLTVGSFERRIKSILEKISASTEKKD